MAKTKSHPLWVRGLKFTAPAPDDDNQEVAPLVGAWIEISTLTLSAKNLSVAPLVGAWIEIS